MAVTTTTEALAAAEELERLLFEAAKVARTLGRFFDDSYAYAGTDACELYRVASAAGSAERTVSYRTRVLRELAEIDGDRTEKGS